MARRRRYPQFRLPTDNGFIPQANFDAPGGPRLVTQPRPGRVVRERMDTPEFALPNVGGLRVVRRRVGNGVRDLVMDQQGNVLLNIAGTGARPTIQRSNTGPDGRGRLVVRRPGAAPGAGAAPTGPGAGGDVVWTGRVNPNTATLDKNFGAGNYAVAQENGKYVVRRKPVTAPGPADPYADYNDYPFIKNYLKGMDDTYTGFQNYLTNTYNPQITAASQALTAQRLAAGGSYNNAIQNYAGSAGNVAAAMTTPQVAGMTGGTVQAPNQNALGAAQSMAATATAARNIDAGARTALGGLNAEKMGQSFLGSAMGYGAGLLNQYGQKRQSERLTLDKWIYEQKAAAKVAKDKQDLDLLKLDQSMINSLIISGDRAAARQATAANAAADRAADAASDAAATSEDYSTRALQLKGWRILPKGAGTKGLNIMTSSDGTKMYKPKSGSGGGSGGGSGSPKPVNLSGAVTDVRNAWKGGTDDLGLPDPSKPGIVPSGKTPTKNEWQRLAVWISNRIKLFPGLEKGNTTNLRAAINEALGGNAYATLVSSGLANILMQRRKIKIK